MRQTTDFEQACLRLSPSAVVVYVMLWHGWRNKSELARKCHLSRSTVYRALSEIRRSEINGTTGAEWLGETSDLQTAAA